MILNINSMRKDGWYTVRTVNVCLISFLLYDWPQNFNSTSRSNIDMNFIFSFGGLYDGWDSWSFHKSKVATDNRDGEHQLLTWGMVASGTEPSSRERGSAHIYKIT